MHPNCYKYSPFLVNNNIGNICCTLLYRQSDKYTLYVSICISTTVGTFNMLQIHCKNNHEQTKTYKHTALTASTQKVHGKQVRVHETLRFVTSLSPFLSFFFPVFFFRAGFVGLQQFPKLSVCGSPRLSLLDNAGS